MQKQNKAGRIGKLLALCGLLWTLTGCWNRLEPKDLAVINSLLYDLGENGQSILTVELINPSGSGTGGNNDVTMPLIVQTRGMLEVDALLHISQIIEKVPFGSLNKARFFSERLASSGLLSSLDFFIRDYRTDETPYMFLVHSPEPERIYDCMTGMSSLLGDYMESMAQVQPQVDNCAVFTRTLAFMKDYYIDGKESVMGVIQIAAPPPLPQKAGEPISAMGSGDQAEQKPPEQHLRCRGLAAFKDAQLVGYLDEQGARAYNMLTNAGGNYIVVVSTDEGKISCNLSNVKSDIKVKYEEGKASFEVKITLAANEIQTGDTSLDITQYDSKNIVEQILNRYIERMVTDTVEQTQREFKSDIFGFGLAMHAQNPADFREIKENWNDVFAKATIQVQVNSNITGIGKSKRPFAIERE